MKIALIVAMDRQGVIGRAGCLPWRLRSDLQRFKRLTMGHAMVMGRKTYDSIGRPLPGRLTIVLSRSKELAIEGVAVVGDPKEAIELGESHETRCVLEAATSLESEPTLYVVGGAEIYALFLDLADELHITNVEAESEGDTRFPEWDRSQWRCVQQQSLPAGEHDEFPTEYQLWIRNK